MTDVTVPLDLWEDDLEGALTVWLVEDGDIVEQGDVLCELTVEKASLEVTAPAPGRIALLVQIETPVKRGAVIARISPP
jgi:pyruvate/2-oxoglutarate dehydrogenase complex dihydrolipoamide acyltransferase (E2) component